MIREQQLFMSGRRQGYLSCPTTFWRTQMLLGLHLALLLSLTGANGAKRSLGRSAACGTCVRVFPACFASREREAGGARTGRIFNNDLRALHPPSYTMCCCVWEILSTFCSPRDTRRIGSTNTAPICFAYKTWSFSNIGGIHT